MLIPLCLEMAKWWWCFHHIGDDEDVTVENVTDENVTVENLTDEDVTDENVTDENIDDNESWPGKRGISAPSF